MFSKGRDRALDRRALGVASPMRREVDDDRGGLGAGDDAPDHRGTGDRMTAGKWSITHGPRPPLNIRLSAAATSLTSASLILPVCALEAEGGPPGERLVALPGGRVEAALDAPAARADRRRARAGVGDDRAPARGERRAGPRRLGRVLICHKLEGCRMNLVERLRPHLGGGVGRSPSSSPLVVEPHDSERRITGERQHGDGRSGYATKMLPLLSLGPPLFSYSWSPPFVLRATAVELDESRRRSLLRRPRVPTWASQESPLYLPP